MATYDLLPVRCFNCGKVLGTSLMPLKGEPIKKDVSKMDPKTRIEYERILEEYRLRKQNEIHVGKNYEKLREEGYGPIEAFDILGITRYCCRSTMMNPSKVLGVPTTRPAASVSKSGKLDREIELARADLEHMTLSRAYSSSTRSLITSESRYGDASERSSGRLETYSSDFYEDGDEDIQDSRPSREPQPRTMTRAVTGLLSVPSGRSRSSLSSGAALVRSAGASSRALRERTKESSERSQPNRTLPSRRPQSPPQ